MPALLPCSWEGVAIPMARVAVVRDAPPLRAALRGAVFDMTAEVDRLLHRSPHAPPARLQLLWNVLQEARRLEDADVAMALRRVDGAVAMAALVACDLLQQGAWPQPLTSLVTEPCPPLLASALRAAWPRPSSRAVYGLAWACLLAAEAGALQALRLPLVATLLHSYVCASGDRFWTAVRAHGYAFPGPTDARGVLPPPYAAGEEAVDQEEAEADAWMAKWEVEEVAEVH